VHLPDRDRRLRRRRCPPASAAEAGQAAALILAPEDVGILETAEAEPVAKAVAAVIGEGKLGQLRQGVARGPRHRRRRREGHGAARPRLKIYAYCVDGPADAANRRITDALGAKDAELEPGGEEDGDSEQAS